MESKLRNMPKIDLHCHLDGSVKASVIREIAKEFNEEFSERELENRLQVNKDCHSLADYLTCFELPIKYLQTEKSLEKAAFTLAMDAAAENVKYLEVRFAPSYITSEGLTTQKIISSVQKGLEKAQKKADIQTGIIVCGVRNLPMEVNLKMLKESMELYKYGVVACDLAGDEKAYPTALFSEFFVSAKKYGIPFTIHSGECGSRENIKTAIELGAKRLGHGIAMAGDSYLMKLCANRNIGVELCPTSNLQTKAIRSWAEYPLPAFMQAGIPVSINTDNRTVSNTNSTNEFNHMIEHLRVSEDDLKQIYTWSIEMSFADDGCKDQLVKKWSL